MPPRHTHIPCAGRTRIIYGTDMSNTIPARWIIKPWHLSQLLYYPFRLLTCVPPIAALLIQNAPEQNLQYGLALIAYALIFNVAIAAAYMVVFRSQWVVSDVGARSLRLVLLILAVGAVDAVGGLWAIYQSGGWGSPFWHMSLASLIVPCAVVGKRWTLGVAAVFLLMHAFSLFVEGAGTVEVWLGPQRYLYIGTIATVFFLSAVIGFLGDVCFALDKSRRRVKTALDNLGTMLEVAQSMALVTSDVNDLMRRVAQTVGERHSYDMVAIYVSEDGQREFQLSGWLGEREDFERYAEDAEGLVGQAASEMDSQLVREGRSWRAAIPIRGRHSLMGVLVMGADAGKTNAGDGTWLGSALAGQIAVGIQITRLRQRLTDAATPEEWDAITREIHDGISGSMYGLKLQLETYAESARLEGNPLTGRLEDLVSPTNELLLDTRSYIYHLLPALRGESCLFTLVENLSWEFEKVSGVSVRQSFSGDPAENGRVPAPVVAGIYRVLKHRMAAVMRSGTASEFRVELHADPANIRLTLSDDGVNYDPGDTESHQALEHLRCTARDMGGELRIEDSGGGRIVLDLTTESYKPFERDKLSDSRPE